MSNASVEAEQKIRDLLERSDRAVERGVVAIYNRQTASEQQIDATTESNGVGFNAVDATFLSSLAKQVIENRHGRQEGSILTLKQRDIARKCLMKYAAQLVQVAEEKVRAKQMQAETPAAGTQAETPAAKVMHTPDAPKPCFVDGCPNNRTEMHVLCPEHLMDRALVERMSRDQFGYTFLSRMVRQ